MLRRAFDTVAAAAGLVVVAPLLAFIAIAIVLDSPGPPWFLQTRVGRNGRPFRIIKLRTMRNDAADRGGPLTVAGDPRVTRLGSILRAAKLDELPQLINVLRGEMALVGPRPEVPEYVDAYDVRQRRVLAVRPGITDPASLRYRDESAVLAAADDPEWAYRTRVLPDKLEMNLDYLERRTLCSDVGVILTTIGYLVRRPRDEHRRSSSRGS